jgi:cell division septation protein DedD
MDSQMTRRIMQRLLRTGFCGVTLLGASLLGAQSAMRPTASDSAVFRRAGQLINGGQAPAGRALVDSVLSASKDGSSMMIDALYWRATFSDSPEAARRDYLRITVEYAQSARAEWALLRLAQVELSRGGRAAARRHLDRLVLEHPEGVTRPQAQYLLGRVMLEDGAVVRGCTVLAEAKQRAASTDIELQNQIAYAQRACGGTALAADSARLDSLRADSVRAEMQRTTAAARKPKATAPAAPAVSAAPAPKPVAKEPVKDETPAKETPKPPVKETMKAAPKVAPEAVAPPVTPPATAPATATAPAATPAGSWTVQLAAYQVLADAERLSAKMKTRGYEVRVTPERPYRVRIGRYATRADAVALVAKLAALQITAIVMEAEKP